MNELVKINPKEFGLEVEQVLIIEQAFLPKIQEREALVTIYDQLITSELTQELCRKAKEVRLKLVKVRTGISDIHKTQKAFFLASGRFVDAWKNKETLPVEQMEEKLSEIENYYINIEKAKKSQLQDERLLEVSKYTEHPASALGEMELQVYEAYLQGLKVAYNAKIEAEAKAEAEKIEFENLVKQRRNRELILLQIDGVKSNPNMTFTLENKENADFSNVIDFKQILDCDEIQFKSYLEEFNCTAQCNIEYENKIKEENARLQAEADRKEKELESERAKVEAERKSLEEKARKEREASEAILKAQQEKARIEAEKAAKELELKEKELNSQKQALEAELKAKADKESAELKAKQESERQAKIEAAKSAKAPDKEKLTVWVNSMLVKGIGTENMSEDSIKVANDIFSKFESFKKWAISEINKL